MNSFLQRFGPLVAGVLCGLDKLRFRGSKRQMCYVTRLLRLLRGHGVIAKIAKTHRYQLTEKGRSKLSALHAARKANTEQLMQAA